MVKPDNSWLLKRKLFHCLVFGSNYILVPLIWSIYFTILLTSSCWSWSSWRLTPHYYTLSSLLCFEEVETSDFSQLLFWSREIGVCLSIVDLDLGPGIQKLDAVEYKAILLARTITVLVIPTSTVIKAEMICMRDIECVVGRYLEIEIAELILITGSPTTQGHYTCSFFSIWLIYYCSFILKILLVVHPGNTFEEGFCKLNSSFFAGNTFLWAR